MRRPAGSAPAPRRHSSRTPHARRPAPRELVLGFTLAFLMTACAEAAAPETSTGDPSDNGGTPPNETPAASPPPPPAFVFVSNESGVDQLYHFDAGAVTRLTTSGAIDTDPHSAEGRLVFVSERDGDAEIYIAGLDAASPTRLTASGGPDRQPTLRHDGDRIAFVSARSGTPRIWLMDDDGDNLGALATGSATYTPESAPAWSPDGSQIAFTSMRTGTSQLFVVSAAGGEAVQITHESAGAFDPVWSADGKNILYTSIVVAARIRAITLATGAVQNYAIHDIGVGDAACDSTACLAATNLYGMGGDIAMYSGAGTEPVSLVATSAREHRPAILVP